ncbi:LysE family translocator [Campylobacter hepaticus]|uniref:Lysine transporter LysE n=1 Tax=Campylobacter hepaticus TaxID=1813019 RepID=A0A424Z1Y8_9BACT|nr:LysE family transporter [Campylobacter hepaticus]AXP08456.1 lysine transporter LysE [Campylobacter hepaticus]MCZ0772288.1 LysE family translocator [Campylobacter hepaticus]MCZ0773756.1 LysE family translocator [Campylobacter hepaticus]MCZ0775007.1 LysE family translocator [Campylobacter hepaticus]MDX2322876.1 LysE family transporter [Campylobacter hepaticus]
MFDSFLSGLFLGFGVSIPFGPVNILILTYALQAFKNSIAVGFGALSIDMCYLFLAQFGLLNFLDYVVFMRFLAIFGFCFLTYMAYLMLRRKNQDLNLKPKKFKESLFKSYIKGAFLNGFNPFVIGFWLSTASVVLSNKHNYFMTLGLIVAILIWICALAFMVARYSYFFNARVIFIINIFSAIIIEYFALSLLYKIFIG